MLVHKLREFEGIHDNDFIIEAGFSKQEVSYRLEFRLKGPLDQLIIPAKAQASRFRDELWKHTCFEAFFQDEGSGKYWEFNFSPSRDWAIYRFQDYRQRIGNPDLEKIELIIQQERYPNDLVMKIDIKPMELFSIGGVGLTTVLEHKDKKISYWALTHPRPKPDFHASESFIVHG